MATPHSNHLVSATLESSDRLLDAKIAEPPPVGQVFLLRDRLRLGPEAAGADFEAKGQAVQPQGALLHVDAEDAVGAGRLAHPAPGVLVADVPPKNGPPPADVALGHGYPSPLTALSAPC